MTAPVTASERDLRTLAGIVSDHRADLPAEGLPPSLLADLMDQIRCDVIRFGGFDSGRQESWFVQVMPDGGEAVVEDGAGELAVATGTANCAVIPTGPATCAAS